MTEGLWETVRSWATHHADTYLYVPLAAPTDEHDERSAPDEQPLQPYESYFRVWLCEMFLANSRHWFRDWYPAVQASVRLKFGDQDDVTFSTVARAPQEGLARGVHINYPITDLLPFNGGMVEVEVALLALQGTDFLDTTIGILEGFSGLVTAPLGQALGIAEKVADGMRELLGATDGQVHLGFHQAFSTSGGGGQNVLAGGYLAVILATPDDLDAARLTVHDDRLHYQPQPEAPAEPLHGFDYMLLRIETRRERDDWRLQPIEEPLNKAIEALIKGDAKQATSFKKLAMIAALQSPDLAVHDRRRVAKAIKDELAQIGSIDGSDGDTSVLAPLPVHPPRRDLNAIMAAHALPTTRRGTLRRMPLAELIGG
jgi:hypothetical protein